MLSEDVVYSTFEDLMYGQGAGLGEWLAKGSIVPIVLERLCALDEQPLSKVQLNQLLVVSHLPSVSDGFFRYYWQNQQGHTYDLSSAGVFQAAWANVDGDQIVSLEHLRWGLMRLYIDALLYFGNVKAGFRSLRSMTLDDLRDFYRAKRFDTEAIAGRGPGLQLAPISKDERYLISEMACKSYGKLPENQMALKQALISAWQAHARAGGGRITVRELLNGDFATRQFSDYQLQFNFSADDILDQLVTSEQDLLARYDVIAVRFERARLAALHNTQLYLSVVNDLDVYVATSMRSREDFRKMASACEHIFEHSNLTGLHLRYFDPTLSAAEGHEDKGLIECLMVKCAKVLVYCAGNKESYGKDAEAAMALSLGKPVVFYCDASQRALFYKDVHPLSRLIDFRSGVAVGAIVTDSIMDVIEILRRLFNNAMQYKLIRHPERRGMLRLCDAITGSVVRVQTDNELLTRTFWNNYHNHTRQRFISLATGKEAERLHE